MYQAIFKQEHAHDDGIWSCAWRKNDATGNDVIVTGSVDDTVKVWKWVEEEKLILQHTLEVGYLVQRVFSSVYLSSRLSLLLSVCLFLPVCLFLYVCQHDFPY